MSAAPGRSQASSHRSPQGGGIPVSRRLVYVVGPSGAGKDSVLAWLRQHLPHSPAIHWARRTITRPARAGDEVHEAVLTTAEVGRLDGDLLHESAEDVATYLAKQNRYTTLAADTAFAAGKRASFGRVAFSPLVRFIKFYLVRQGFRDGLPGDPLHDVLQGAVDGQEDLVAEHGLGVGADGLRGQLVVEGVLDAREGHVVDADEAHHVRGEAALGVGPAEVVLQADALQLPAGFLLVTPWERLKEYPRYLQAVEQRLEKYIALIG